MAERRSFRDIIFGRGNIVDQRQKRINFFRDEPVQPSSFVYGYNTSAGQFDLKDLQSRVNSFTYIGIELPTDDLLKVIISKTLSDKQISINPKISDYIINNVERSYEKLFKFLKDVDEMSLSTGKSININLIKKVLNK